MAMAALVGLAVVAIQPQPSDQVVEPAPPITVSTVTQSASLSDGGTDPSRRPGATASRGGSGGPHRTPAAGPTSVAAMTPTRSASVGPTTSTQQNSPTLPPAAFRPARADDVDGDGTADQVRLTGGTTLEATFSRGGTTSVPLPVPAVSPLRKAIVDIDGDGYSEVILQVTATATGTGIESFAVLRYGAASTLQPALTASPPGPLLTAGVSGTSASGFRCTGTSLQAIAGSSTDGGGTFQVTTTTWDLTIAGFAQQGDPASSTVSDTALFVPACGTLS
jgi:hypothetical protein